MKRSLFIILGVSIVLSLLAIAQSMHIIDLSNIQLPLLSPECQSFKDKTPQTVEEIAKLYDISSDRVEIFSNYKCPSDVFWGYYIHEGDPVEVTVPKGGEIIIYDVDGYNGVTGTFYSGTFVVKKVAVFAGKFGDK